MLRRPAGRATAGTLARPLLVSIARIPPIVIGRASLVAAGLDLLPMALLAIAAAARPVRLPLVGALVLGTLLSARHDRRRTPAWAAALPVTLSLAWGLVALPPAARDGSTCAAPFAPFATYRLVEAIMALGAVALLARRLGGGARELGLRWPEGPSLRLGLAGGAVAGPVGLLLGPSLARPFFGEVAIDTSHLATVVPAVAFALSNGMMEEVVYRGSLRAWTARVTGTWPALVGQAVVFGFAHTGPDFTGSPLPVAAAMFAGGLAAGLIVRRTGSLFAPIAIHAGLDIPLFYGNACRLT